MHKGTWNDKVMQLIRKWYVILSFTIYLFYFLCRNGSGFHALSLRWLEATNPNLCFYAKDASLQKEYIEAIFPVSIGNFFPSLLGIFLFG